MRIAANSHHMNYNCPAIHAKVFLDGVALNDCLFADEEAGTVERIARDGAGHVMVNAGGYVQSEVHIGHVRVDLSDCELPVEFIGFEAWMRARTDRAHAEFMTRTAAL